MSDQIRTPLARMQRDRQRQCAMADYVSAESTAQKSMQAKLETLLTMAREKRARGPITFSAAVLAVARERDDLQVFAEFVLGRSLTIVEGTPGQLADMQADRAAREQLGDEVVLAPDVDKVRTGAKPLPTYLEKHGFPRVSPGRG